MDAVVAVTALCAMAFATAAAYLYRRHKEKRALERAVMESLQRRVERLKKENDEWRLALNSNPVLKYRYETDSKEVRVVATNYDGAGAVFSLTLKAFPYDCRDIDDYFFAVREAEELIEKLTE